VVGVWAGNADNSPMRGVSGVTGAAPIWHDILVGALQGRLTAPFPRPSGLTTAVVCTDSGELAGPICPHRALETFIAGDEPRRVDTSWRLIRVDTVTGHMATATTPAARSAWRLYRVFPPEARAWAAAHGYPDLPAPAGAPAGLTLRPQAQGAGDALLLSTPPPQALYQISTALPRSDQRIAITAQAGDLPPARVALSIDHRVVATFDAPPYTMDWTLQPGQHVVEVAGWDARGRRLRGQAVRITVLGPG
jgi:penicillin-binding protein 1C